MNGYYECNEGMVEGLPLKDNNPANAVPFCWCNPNFEWDKYKYKTVYYPYRAKQAYDNWSKQAQLGETRNCNGLVAIVDIWNVMYESN